MTEHKLRLLVLTSTFPRWLDDSEPPFVFELSRRLTGTFAVTVLAPRAPGSQNKENMSGLHVVRFPYFIQRWEILAAHDGGILNRLKANRLNYLLVPFFLIGQTWALIRLLRQESFDIIHAHWLIPQGVIAILGRSLASRNIPIICTSHGGDLYALRNPILQRLKRWVIDRSQALTVVSSAMRKHVIDMDIPPDKVQVISMGVDLKQRFTPDPGVTRSNNELLFVGRLVEKKGLRILFHAIPQILSQYPDIRLTVAGSGPLEPELRALGHSLGVADKINFLGMVTQTELPDLYRRATLFVAPFVIGEDGDQEGLGLVMVEAMGCGCPVIASDLPAIHDVIEHGATGWLVPSDNSSMLTQAIEQLLANSQLRRNLSTQALANINQKFSWDIIATAYTRKLRSLCCLSTIR